MLDTFFAIIGMRNVLYSIVSRQGLELQQWLLVLFDHYLFVIRQYLQWITLPTIRVLKNVCVDQCTKPRQSLLIPAC